MEVKQKPIKSSKTIWVGGFYFTVGTLAAIIQALDFSESILSSMGMGDMPPEVAFWVSIILAIIGIVQVKLRMVTTQPIGNKPVESPTDQPPESNTAG
jgi:hypothetical protein